MVLGNDRAARRHRRDQKMRRRPGRNPAAPAVRETGSDRSRRIRRADTSPDFPVQAKIRIPNRGDPGDRPCHRRRPQDADDDRLGSVKPMLKAVAWILVGPRGCSRSSPWRSTAANRSIRRTLVVAAPVHVCHRVPVLFEWLTARVLMVDDRRATRAKSGRMAGTLFAPSLDCLRTPLRCDLGPGSAGRTGVGGAIWIPACRTLWILVGVVLRRGGPGFDHLFASLSTRRPIPWVRWFGRNSRVRRRGLALVAILVIAIILLAVLALIVVNALAESPWECSPSRRPCRSPCSWADTCDGSAPERPWRRPLIGVVLLLGAVWVDNGFTVTPRRPTG